jgi:hypothetical protein
MSHPFNLTGRGKYGDATPADVKEFHSKADTDSSALALHHTLGPKKDQASPGNHTHNGDTSRLILEGVVISGAKGGNTALASVINALKLLGATDSTT